VTLPGTDPSSSDGGAPTEPPDAGSIPSLIADTGDSGFEQTDAAPTLLEPTDAGEVSFDIVSSAQCAYKSGYLIHCSRPPIVVHDPNAQEWASPRKTTLIAQQTGDCSSAYPLQLTVSAAGLPATVFHLADGAVDVRRLDRAPIADLAIADDSPYRVAHYQESCRMWVSVRSNQSDAPQSQLS
jgi:hypothetical protein